LSNSFTQNLTISGTANHYLRVDQVLTDRVRVSETISGELSNFVEGDIVLLIQMTGGMPDTITYADFKTFEYKTRLTYNQVGWFEILQVDEKITGANNYIVFTDNVKKTYDAGEKIQLVRFVTGESVKVASANVYPT
jgi:hypothetical protein